MARSKRKKTAKKQKQEDSGIKRVAINRKARHLYEFLDNYEAGIELIGSEVKGVRESGADLKDSFVRIDEKGAVAVGVHISQYSSDGSQGYEPKRDRRLLLHKREIGKIAARINEKGYTAIPMEMYFNKNGLLKLKLGIARGKRSFDKKQVLKERDIKRQMDRELKERNR